MTKAIQIKNISLGSGMPKICVPLTSKTRKDLYEEAERTAAAHPDLVEWRADAYEDLLIQNELLKTLKNLTEILGEIPLLFTIRTSKEGGPIEIANETYAAINLTVAESNMADLIDIELFQNKEEKVELIQKLHAKGAVVIASSHDFDKTDTPEVLLSRFLEMDQSGADILKMAVMPKSFQDVLAILSVTNQMVEKETEKPVISMSMGALGTISRICGESAGSALTFGTVGAASAPGQISMQVLRGMMEVLHQNQ